jgi:hypothetical protein
MDYEFNGQSLSVKPGEQINYVDSERVMGYNRIIMPNENNMNHRRKMKFGFDNSNTNQYTSSIHIRLRLPNPNYNHETQFLSYELICEHVCHELAHCVYHDHSPEFYTLMSDIQKQHSEQCLLLSSFS